MRPNEFKSEGPGELLSRVLKELAKRVFEPWAIIVTKSWEMVDIPEKWKRANTEPFLKKEEPEMMGWLS